MAPWPLPLLQGRWKSYADAPRSMTDEGVTILRPRYLNIPGQPSIARPDRFIARAAERTRKRWADARVIHGHYAVTGLAAWRMARKLDLPLVLSFHGGDLNSWPDEYPDRVRDLRAAMRDAAAAKECGRRRGGAAGDG